MTPDHTVLESAFAEVLALACDIELEDGATLLLSAATLAAGREIATAIRIPEPERDRQWQVSTGELIERYP